MFKQIDDVIQKCWSTMFENFSLEPLLICFLVVVHLPNSLTNVRVKEQVKRSYVGGRGATIKTTSYPDKS